MNTYKFYLPGYTGSEEDPYTFKAAHAPYNSEGLAEDAADYYHSNCDGWEDTWPLTFCVYFEGEWHTHKVDREAVPSFYVVG